MIVFSRCGGKYGQRSVLFAYFLFLTLHVLFLLSIFFNVIFKTNGYDRNIYQ